ncbi:MAG: hypothetical protein KA116_08635 [Proteobacteria bacterium]|nr:hypothetical protein [Pseudomonadota bacterium]
MKLKNFFYLGAMLIVASCGKKSNQNPAIIPGENKILSYSAAVETFKEVSPDRVVHTVVVPFGLKSDFKIYVCPNHECLSDPEYLLSCLNAGSLSCEVKVFNGKEFQSAGMSAYSSKGSSKSGRLEFKIVDPFNQFVPKDPFAIESINSESQVSNRVFSK